MFKAKALASFDNDETHTSPNLFTVQLTSPRCVCTMRLHHTDPDGVRVFKSDEFDLELSESDINFAVFR